MSFRFNFPDPKEDDDSPKKQSQDINREDEDLRKDCTETEKNIVSTEVKIEEKMNSECLSDGQVVFYEFDEDLRKDCTETEKNIVSTEVKIEEKMNSECLSDGQVVFYEFGEDLKIESLSPKFVEEKLKTNAEQRKNNSAFHDALLSSNDLVPNKYEGGLQIWECCIDLSKFISSKDFSSEKVVELGCGSGLPGICALKKGAKYVLFQDYNREVLKNLTIPNVLLNCAEDKERCYFFCGDWKTLPKALQASNAVPQKYDVILTAETIYSTMNYSKLINLFNFLLEENGDIFLAAKTYYFGVGGGTRQFEQKILEDQRFISKVVWTQTQGVSREILHLQRKKP